MDIAGHRLERVADQELIIQVPGKEMPLESDQ